MELYFLDDTEVVAPQGIAALTRQKTRSRRYFSVLYRNVGYASGVGNVSFLDTLSRNLLLTPYRESKVAANVRFRSEYNGQTEFDAFVDFLSFSYNRDRVTCAFRDEQAVTTLESQAVASFGVPTQTTIVLRPKRVTGPSTHTINSLAATVQRSTPGAQPLNHALPLVKPEKEDTTLPGQLLTVETPLGSTPMYRNTTNEVQSLQLSGKAVMSFSASATVSAYLSVFVYSPNGEVEEIPQGTLLLTTSTNSHTLLLRGNALVQPGGWIVVGFRGDAVQRFSFTYGADTAVTLESTNQAPESRCRGLLAGDLLAQLVEKATDGAMQFASRYFSTGDGSTLFITNGANLRGLDKSLTATLQDIFEGITSFEPLALWLDGLTVRCEPLAEYLQQHATRTTFDAEIISATYRPNASYIASEILTGFESWRGDGPLAGDEFNGFHRYVSPYKTARQPLDLRSKLIASGSLIEQQRRKQFSDKTASTSADGDDERLFVLCVATDRSGQLIGETRQRTGYISNTVDTETPYNVRLSPARSLRRWATILPLNRLILESSEGNTEFVSRYDDGDFVRENDSLFESNNNPLLGDEQVEVAIPMTQQEFNSLGDWITFYDEGKEVTGLLMDAVWRTTNDLGEVAQLMLFM
ncbi:hypothetical protein [Spirosoma oryzicola]|uniref:hypothetical protein n=1 Tax=Spirosoma oryzicola TaxID=2898794 RepID=UPI001E65B74F|nr:hypothetical protein [Spirosoma oryzicola]UHG91759.1 hypothetical protein LQ777_02405 [Spirosoma oryzicola]